MSTDNTPSTSSPTPNPVEAASAALARRGAPEGALATFERLAAQGMSGQPQSNPGEQAAPGGDVSAKVPSQVPDAEMQEAQAYLHRFGVTDEFLKGATPEQKLGLGRHLREMQKGISKAKTKAEQRIEQLEAQVIQLATVARQPAPGSATPVANPIEADLKALADELGGDVSKIGPALERVIATHLAKIAPPAATQSEAAMETVQALAIESARTQLVGQFPPLQPGTPLYEEVQATMRTRCQGPYYDALPLGTREVVRMRDAATYVLGAPGAAGAVPNQTPARTLSAPRPDGSSGAQAVQLTPLEAAQASLSKAGHRS